MTKKKESPSAELGLKTRQTDVTGAGAFAGARLSDSNTKQPAVSTTPAGTSTTPAAVGKAVGKVVELAPAGGFHFTDATWKEFIPTVDTAYPTETGGTAVVKRVYESVAMVEDENGRVYGLTGGVLRRMSGAQLPVISSSTTTATPLLATDGGSTVYKPTVQLVSELLAQEFPPLVFLVDGVLAKGHLAMLGGRPKAGKSWFLLQLAQAIDGGLPFLGYDTRRGRVLYVALEDGARRVHRRCHLIKWKPTPGAAVLLSIAYLDGQGDLGPGLTQIEQLAPDYDLIMVDTLISAVSPRAKENDNNLMGSIQNELARIAHANDTAILINHHTTKGTAEDVFGMLRGAGAIRGAYDVGMLLERKQGEREAVLHFESRDAEISALTIRQLENGAGWENLGAALEIKNIRAGRRVVEILQAAGGDELTIVDIAKQLAVSPQAAGAQLRNAERDGLVSRRSESRAGSLKPIDLWCLRDGSSASHKATEQKATVQPALLSTMVNS